MTKYDSYSKKINYAELQYLLEHMDYQSKLYKLIKAELKKRGNWKDKAKGGSFKSKDDPRRHPLAEERAADTVTRADGGNVTLHEAAIAANRVLLRVRKRGKI